MRNKKCLTTPFLTGTSQEWACKSISGVTRRRDAPAALPVFIELGAPLPESGAGGRTRILQKFGPRHGADSLKHKYMFICLEYVWAERPNVVCLCSLVRALQPSYHHHDLKIIWPDDACSCHPTFRHCSHCDKLPTRCSRHQRYNSSRWSPCLPGWWTSARPPSNDRQDSGHAYGKIFRHGLQFFSISIGRRDFLLTCQVASAVSAGYKRDARWPPPRTTHQSTTRYTRRLQQPKPPL